MTKYFTADEARQLADQNQRLHEAIVAITDYIKVTAEAGNTSIKVRDYGFSSGSCYATTPPFCQAIIDKLEALGYTTKIRSEDRQFVDMWLEVSW